MFPWRFKEDFMVIELVSNQDLMVIGYFSWQLNCSIQWVHNGKEWDEMGWMPLVICYNLLLRQWHIETVDLPN